jgi:DNA-binding transcriptional MocR family regulator
MSFALIPLVWEKVCGDDATARLVLLWLTYRADNSGSCYPSLADIVGHTGLSRSTVQRALDRLVEADVVRLGEGVPRRANLGGRSKPHNFHLNLDRLREAEPVKLSRKKSKETVSPVHPFNSSKRCHADSKRVSERRENGVTVTPEPVIEPVRREPVMAPL